VTGQSRAGVPPDPRWHEDFHETEKEIHSSAHANRPEDFDVAFFSCSRCALVWAGETPALWHAQPRPSYCVISRTRTKDEDDEEEDYEDEKPHFGFVEIGLTLQPELIASAAPLTKERREFYGTHL